MMKIKFRNLNNKVKILVNIKLFKKILKINKIKNFQINLKKKLI
jgi:hypothetical protein